MIQNFPSELVHDISHKFENGLTSYDEAMGEIDSLFDSSLLYDSPIKIRFCLHPQYTEAISEGLDMHRRTAILNMDIDSLTCLTGSLYEIIDVEGRLFAVFGNDVNVEHTGEKVFVGSFAKWFYVSIESFQEVNEEVHHLEQEIQDVQEQLMVAHDVYQQRTLESDLDYLLNERQLLKEEVEEELY